MLLPRGGIRAFKDQELQWAYDELVRKQPQLPEYRRARLAILDLLEERGRERDAETARTIKEYERCHSQSTH